MRVRELPFLVAIAMPVFLVGIGVSSCHLASQTKCPCGLTVGQTIYYSGPPADRLFPDPRVIEVATGAANQEVIRVRLNALDGKSNLKELEVHSIDGGLTWVDGGVPTFPSGEFSHPPLRYRLSIYGTQLEWSNDEGTHWQTSQTIIDGMSAKQFASRLGGSNFSDIQLALSAVHPRDPKVIYGCVRLRPKLDESTGLTLENAQAVPGMYVSHDSGDHWTLFSQQLRGLSSEGYCTLGINPSNPNIMVGQGRLGVIISRNGGREWMAVGQQGELEKPVRLKGYAESVALLKEKGIEIEKKEAPSWTYLIVTAVEFQRDNENVIYLVANKGLYKTEDGGRSWCLLDTGTSTLFDLDALWISDTNPRRIFVGTSTKVLASEDAGCHFREIFDAVKFMAGDSSLLHELGHFSGAPPSKNLR